MKLKEKIWIIWTVFDGIIGSIFIINEIGWFEQTPQYIVHIIYESFIIIGIIYISIILAVRIVNKIYKNLERKTLNTAKL